MRLKLRLMERRKFLMFAAAAAIPAAMRFGGPAAAAAETRPIAALGGVEEFVERMRQHAFAPDELRMLFSQMRANARVISLMDAPSDPARKTYWRAYRKRSLAPRIVAEGMQFMRRNAESLSRAEEAYGAPREIVAAILGAETRYGRVLGGFATARALATLAFAYPRRAEEFQGELESLLLYAREEGINPLRLRGSFAGAFGMPQFLPSSARKFAVDFDNDGRADLFAAADAAGSIGNFLQEHGWQRGGAVSLAVKQMPDDPRALMEATRKNDYKPTFTGAELAAAGVQADGMADDAQYLFVDLENRFDTEYRLGAQNFYALTRYNKSFKYAAAVFDLSVALRAQ